jgi:hypothetical protein
MSEHLSPSSAIRSAESLDDVTIREQQLETHLLQSPEYLRRADQELKRQVAMLYLAIALLLLLQGLFTWRTAGRLPLYIPLLTGVTSFLAIANCLLLIRTKACLRRLNATWLSPEERAAVEALRRRRTEILSRPPAASTDSRGRS